MRKADRRTGSGAGVPQQHPAAPKAKWWCVTDGCGFTAYGAGPADGLCHDCRTEMEADPIDPAELAEAARAFAAAGFHPDVAH
ncbi:hypothetical protein [Streptomyces sp. NRRL WC-3742]|uniref:hypothetical protein n=1 Tax=Streptomyces sp. NRRL WC-3742 TaxID=1463934 RepID=UPI000AB7371D|nr:hypothetical protein [Streptomyces sp. NRRL WC-3742]